MSVYIKGMEMPTRCEDCFCYWHNAEFDYAYCIISSVNVRGHGNARLVGCPIIPVPDHGDLIDRDAYKAEMKKRQDNCAEWRDNAKADGDMEIYHRADGALSVFCEAKLTLDKMPTIIPADHADKEAGE